MINVRKQDGYDAFRCTADKCPKSCCTGWQIVIDDEALERYEKLTGPFAERMHSSIDWEEGCFQQIDGRCAMLNANGLCDLQTALSEESLCGTCKMFPRHMEEFEGLLEYSLSLSCPEAARLLSLRKEPMHFTTVEMDEEEAGYDDSGYEDFDYLMFTKLSEAREILFKIAKNRELLLTDRMALILSLTNQLQYLADEGETFEMDTVLSKYRDTDPEVLLEADHFQAEDISVLTELEILESDWGEWIEAGLHCQEEMNVEALFENASEQESIFMEQILVMLIYTYFCGAVYDFWIYSKAALAVYSVQWIYMIYRGCKMMNGMSMAEDEGRELLTKVLYLYAREIEHSDENLNALEELFFQHAPQCGTADI